MNKIIPVLTALFLLSPVPLKAQNINYDKEYNLRMQACRIDGADYEEEPRFYKMKLSEIGNKLFLLTPVGKATWRGKWLHSVEPEKKGWIGAWGKNSAVKIFGILQADEFYTKMELKGSLIAKNTLKGDAVVHVGMGRPKEDTPFVYTSEWALEPADTKNPVKLSHRVTYHGPPLPPPRKPKYSTPEERAKRPPQGDSGIKTMAGYPPGFREGLPPDKELDAYYDKLLSELTWDEIKDTPGILLLIDHLATLEKPDQKRIANMYVKDGSVNFFGDTPYEELRRTPPALFDFKMHRPDETRRHKRP